MNPLLLFTAFCPRVVRLGRRFGVVVLLLGAFLVPWKVAAAGGGDGAVVPEATPVPAPTEAASPNANCRMCHTNHRFQGRFQNGEIISLYVDEGAFGNSVHGPAGLECIACHPKTKSYPHQPSNPQIDCTTCHLVTDGTVGKVTRDLALTVDLPFADHRAMTLEINQACHTCHERAYTEAADSMHVRAMESGNRHAPVCADCHGSHAIATPGQPREKVTEICGQCHRAVYTTYRSSVHGAALAKDPTNADVPTCVDCHGVHSVRGPRSATFHNDTIAICGGCHQDPERMAKYGVSTAVYRTYLDDFHGRSVNLARLAGTGQNSPEATCFDCHGTHNIQAADDPRAMVTAENLQRTCQRCHKGANARFPQAWMGHRPPTWDTAPVVAAINMVYGYGLVPGVIGGFLVFIALDARKRWREKHRRWREAVAEAEKEIEAELGADDDHHPA